jgi:hypothetical protein
VRVVGVVEWGTIKEEYFFKRFDVKNDPPPTWLIGH